MRQPSYVPDRDQLLKDFHGGDGGLLDDVAPDAVSITVDEYLNPRDSTPTSPTETILSSVSTSSAVGGATGTAAVATAIPLLGALWPLAVGFVRK